MSATFLPQRMRFSIDRYHRMVAAHVLTERDHVELIEGEILQTAPIGTPHAATTVLLTERLTLGLGRAATISVGGPLVLGDFSEPEPDLVLLGRREDCYRGKHPTAADALLLIEVSELAGLRSGSQACALRAVSDLRVLGRRSGSAAGPRLSRAR